MKEKLSAFIDGELDELDQRRVLNALAGDDELRRTWERYHLIRAAMTRQLATLAPPDLPGRVRAALEADEVRQAAPRLRFWPLAGGFAAAAAVATIAIFGVQLLQTPAGTPAVPLAAAPSTGVQVVAVAPAGAASAASTAPAAEAAVDPLNLYLVGHNEFMPTGGMGSMLPYVRVVAHGSDK